MSSGSAKRSFYFKVSPAKHAWKRKPEGCIENKINKPSYVKKETTSEKSLTSQKDPPIFRQPKPRKPFKEVQSSVRPNLDEVSTTDVDISDDENEISTLRPMRYTQPKRSTISKVTQSAPNTPARRKVPQVPIQKKAHEPTEKRFLDIMATPQRVNYNHLFKSIGMLHNSPSSKGSGVLKQLPVNQNSSPARLIPVTRKFSEITTKSPLCYRKSNSPRKANASHTRHSSSHSLNDQILKTKYRATSPSWRTPGINASNFYSPATFKQSKTSISTLRATARPFDPVSPSKASEMSVNESEISSPLLPRPYLSRPISSLRVHSGFVTPMRKPVRSPKKNERRERKIPFLCDFGASPSNPSSPNKFYWGDEETPLHTPRSTPRRKKGTPYKCQNSSGIDFRNETLSNRPRSLLWGEITPIRRKNHPSFTRTRP